MLYGRDYDEEAPICWHCRQRGEDCGRDPADCDEDARDRAADREFEARRDEGYR